MSDEPEYLKAWREHATADDAEAKRRGLMIVGFPRQCRCGGRAYHAPKSDWQNRVICLACGKEWSE